MKEFVRFPGSTKGTSEAESSGDKILHFTKITPALRNK